MSSTGNTGATSGMTFLGVFTTFLAPALVGALLAALGLFGLVYSQTQTPDKNPASQQILVYGD
ncbi:hypothetical protein SAMN05192575_11413 [Nocardioides alpinus]|uniref:Uncharacterized protein n=1 Tax=Nocardioides alpinus TaxID=748909 RepID=A0A1I1B785_9ACTN|nr:hypothetical protein [Nocardioides alpinus]PKH41367.1 hypothetical protein CXG46_09790 [Nocardioides alpinus]SFB45526.1 hypothetical protein SAMN05192575_11413 [Nocardioides alpinus]